MTTSFNQLAHDVVTARKNWGAPESMKLKESVSTKTLPGVTITIDEVIVMNKKKYDKTTKKVVLTKDGKEMYQPVVYVAFDGTKFFVSKSALLVEQLEKFSGKKLTAYELKDFKVDEIKGITVKISAEKTKYRNGEEYDQLIFADAE